MNIKQTLKGLITLGQMLLCQFAEEIKQKMAKTVMVVRM